MNPHDPRSAPRRASTPHDFSPAAIMARADAHGIQQAARASKVGQLAQPSPDEILAAIAAGIAAHAPEPPRPEPGAPSAEALLAGIARQLDGERS